MWRVMIRSITITRWYCDHASLFVGWLVRSFVRWLRTLLFLENHKFGVQHLCQISLLTFGMSRSTSKVISFAHDTPATAMTPANIRQLARSRLRQLI